MLEIRSVWAFPRVEKIGAEQVSAIVQATPAVLLGSALNTAIAAVSVAGSVALTELVLWCLASCIVLGLAAYRSHGRKNKPIRSVSLRTIRRAAVFAVLLALPWSVLITGCLGSLSHREELILVALCAGMAASGSVYLSPVYPAALAYMLVILLPAAMKCFLVPGYGMLGWLTLSFAGFLSAVIATNARLSIDRTRAVRELADAANSLRHRDEELTTQNARFETALNNMSQGLCFFDADQRLIVCNNMYIDMYGLDRRFVYPGMPLAKIVEMRFAVGSCPVMSETDYLAWRSKVGNATAPSDTVYELKNGRIIEIHYRPMPDGGWVATHDDITERQKLSERLEQNHKLLGERTSLLQGIIDNFPGGIGFVDQNLRIAVCNSQAKTILDLPPRVFAGGPPPLEDVLRFNALRGEYGPGDAEEQVASKLALARNRVPYRFERTRPDGTVLDVRGAPLASGGFITTYMDITERYRSEAKIAHMALHDALTGLPNRVMLNQRLDHALTRAARGERVAVHLLDLDRFKAVNDTLGHPVGDKLLQIVADRLRALIRETDTVARMGGDEFAIIQVGIAEPIDATSLAQRAISAMSRPFDIDGRQVVVGTSIGITVAPADGLTSAELIKKADMALYGAKNDGRGIFRFFEPEMDARMQARYAVETDLRKALAAGEFELHYQPMVNLEGNEVSGFEALLRWNHPVKGIVSPETFIQLAEEIGLIVPIGDWTIREACEAASTWPHHMRVAVNLSPAQFRHPNLRQAVADALSASRLAPNRLELEINETALWEDIDTALDILYQLRALGVRVAMDDFGTGHSSLNYLQSFPFDRIKIDRSFLKDITDAGASLKIVRAITALAQGLGMETTAEGVESAEQLAVINAEGCTEIQGFLVSKAVPSDELQRRFIRDRRDAKVDIGNAAA